ncbi:MAG: mechanosensitive ion channel family protein, partial [Deferrisomatales bacterium]
MRFATEEPAIDASSLSTTIGDLAVALALAYAFTLLLRHGLRGDGEARAASLVAALLLVPAAAVIHWHGGWDVSAASPLNDPARWWVIPVAPAEGQPARVVNLVTAAFLLGLLYVAATAVVAGGAAWYNRRRGGPLQALHRGLVKWLVVVAGLLVYLKTLGIALTPLLFGMGAASIVVGLALQEPLSNLFAGLALDAEGAIRQGDWIRVDVDGGTVGQVIDKGWRTTRLLTLDRELVTLPNRVMGGQKIVNYH